MITYAVTRLIEEKLNYRKMAKLCTFLPAEEYKLQLRGYARIGAWVCLAWDGDVLVGSAGYMPAGSMPACSGLGVPDVELDRYWVPSIVYVHQAYEGQGIGTQLVDALYDHAHDNGVSHFLHMGFITPGIMEFMHRDTWVKISESERNPYGVFTEHL